MAGMFYREVHLASWNGYVVTEQGVTVTRQRKRVSGVFLVSPWELRLLLLVFAPTMTHGSFVSFRVHNTTGAYVLCWEHRAMLYGYLGTSTPLVPCLF